MTHLDFHDGQSTGQSLGDGIPFFFFFRYGPPLKDGVQLRIFTVISGTRKNAELGITGQKFSGAHARRSPFAYIWAGDRGGGFFSLRTALAEY